jgi:RNA polymerase sigma-70 factor (ECF subfamily)
LGEREIYIIFVWNYRVLLLLPGGYKCNEKWSSSTMLAIKLFNNFVTHKVYSSSIIVKRPFSQRKERLMEDNQIVQLYFDRSEEAISQTAVKYGKYCHTIAYNILHNFEDSEECVNDTYQKAWDTIPPKTPQRLSTYLGKITRNLSISRLSYEKAQKRNVNLTVILSELDECIPKTQGSIDDSLTLKYAIDKFLRTLQKEVRIIFVRRYWYASSIKEIARDYDLSESKVKVTLHRVRIKFKEFLEEEGVNI